ncbi:MAG: MFS transporter [Dehalococcoidia bacterium]|nr:MFS transporter [Dehalococcoidia bacterium]
MKKYSVAIVVSISAFIFALDTTMMNVAITALTQDLNTEIQNIQFAIAFYALVIAAFMLLGAKLATIYGTKRIFIIGVILYGIGTLTAALSVNVGMLTVGWSVIEGIGSAFMIPCAVTFLVIDYQGKERAVAFAIFTSVSVGAAAIGPIVGGAFTTYLNWRWAFGMEFFLVVIILIFSHVLTEQRRPEKPKLDVGGALLSALGFGCIVFGVISTTTYGWWIAKKPLVIAGVAIAPVGLSIAAVLMITGGIILLLFILWERRQERKGNEPLLPISLLNNRSYMAGGALNLIEQLCLAALLFTMPFFLQSVLSKTAMETGLILMPLTLAMLMTMLLTPRFGAKIPVKYLTMGGVCASVAGTVLLANSFSADMTATALVPGFVLFGLGMGLALAQLQNLALSSVEPGETDEASGLFNTLRNLGGSLGTAIVGTLLLTFFLSGLVLGVNGSGVLPQVDKDELTTLVTQSTREMGRGDLHAEIRSVLGEYPVEYKEELKVITVDAVEHSMRVTYYTLAGILGAGLVVSLFLSKRKLVLTNGKATGSPT